MIKSRHIVFLFTLAVLAIFSRDTFAQSSRESESEKQKNTSSTFQFSSSKKASKKAYGKKKGDALDQYEQQKKDVQKQHTKMEKGMRKPQYSDPSYFGHKRPPKKRKTGKKKFCKECGMTH